MSRPELCGVYVAALSDGQVSSEALKGHASPPIPLILVEYIFVRVTKPSSQLGT